MMQLSMNKLLTKTNLESQIQEIEEQKSHKVWFRLEAEDLEEFLELSLRTHQTGKKQLKIQPLTYK